MRRLALLLLLAAPLSASTVQEANAALDRGDFMAAAKAYEAAGSVQPARREAWRLNNWGLALIRAEKPSLALPVLEEAIKVDSKNGTAWGNLGHAYELIGDRGKAIEIYRRAIHALKKQAQALPLSPPAEPTDPGVPAFSQADSALKGEELKAALAAASKLMDEAKFEEVAKAYEAMGRIRPAKREAWRLNNWALALMRLGRYAEARARLEASVKALPGNPVAWNNLGVSYQHLALPVKARQAYARASQLSTKTFDGQRAELNQVKIEFQSLRQGTESGDTP